MENLKTRLTNIASHFIESEKINSAMIEYMKELETKENLTQWLDNIKDIIHEGWFFGVMPEDIAAKLLLQFCTKRKDGMKATFYMRLSNTKIGWISITGSDGKTFRWDPFCVSLPEDVVLCIKENKGFTVHNFDGFVTYEASKNDCDFAAFLKEYKKAKKE